MSASQKTNHHPPAEKSAGGHWLKPALLTLAALGVVYGDIGTSPLYALRECFFGRYSVAASAANVLGVLSLVVWSLIVVISLKYLLFVLRANNDGEGGILALMELVKRPSKGLSQKMILIAGLFGAALLYGDGMITPAISVLSAVEGLNVATTAFHSYVVPITVAVLVALFLVQKFGTGSVGRCFGPVMLLWFCTLAATGVVAISKKPAVLAAFNPLHGARFLVTHGFVGLSTLGFVFLVVTGGEALYADIGHFGKLPIRAGWYGIALPGLLLNYLGQGAAILARPGKISNPFYQMAPAWALYPMVGLATIATVIASQAIIAGAFSLTFQGFQLGYLPRLNIRHTSASQRGRIYIPLVNWTLLAATTGLVIGFRHSSHLASAYGVAISATMVITSALLFVAMRKIFRWPAWVAMGLTTIFLGVDLAFFVANVEKFLDGGWFPLLAAAVIFLLMATWRRGFALERRKRRNHMQTVRQFLLDIGGGGKYRRVPGQAVYLAGNSRGTPHPLKHNLTHNRALHETLVIYTASFVKFPRVPAAKRFKVSRLRHDMTRVVAYYGFMESPNVPRDLTEANQHDGLDLDLDRVTYFVGGEILLAKKEIGMTGWRSALYALMARNEMRATRYFNLPPHQVFEIGTQIEV